MQIKKIWVATLTKLLASEAGTDSGLYLSIEIEGQEVFRQNLPDSPVDDLETGRANLFRLDVNDDLNIDLDLLSDSSVRLGIRGDDAWKPEHAFVWFESAKNPLMASSFIHPVALAYKSNRTLSTDIGEGDSSMGLRRVDKGNASTQIRRLLLIVLTDYISTDFLDEVNPYFIGGYLEVQITTDDKLVVHTDIRSTAQNDIGNGVANYYQPHVIFPFSKQQLDNSSIVIQRKDKPSWILKSLFLFGLNTRDTRPTRIVPLVYLPELETQLEADPTTGAIRLELSLVNEGIDLSELETKK